MLDDKQVSYDVVEVDMVAGDERQQALAEVDKLTGKRSFPVTVIDETVIQGYKVDELERALDSEA